MNPDDMMPSELPARLRRLRESAATIQPPAYIEAELNARLFGAVGNDKSTLTLAGAGDGGARLADRGDRDAAAPIPASRSRLQPRRPSNLRTSGLQ